MKQSYMLLGSILAALILTWIAPYFRPNQVHSDIAAATLLDDAIIPQAMSASNEGQRTYHIIYEKERVIGILSDKNKLDALLVDAYEQSYQQDYPNTKLGLGEDIHIVDEVSLFTYEDKDEEILNYIHENQLFSVEAHKIEFSNGEVMYVKNLDDFVAARDAFALNFIDEESYRLLNSGKETPELGEYQYGSRVKDAAFKEDMSVSRGLAPISKIAKSEEEALKIISYGYEGESEYYTTQEYDTVQGIAWLNHLSIPHLLALNADVLVSENQLLKVGTELNVTSINSPIHFEVTKENQVEEVVYPNETLIIYDDTLREGSEFIETKQELGRENARYQETFVNGQSTGSGKKISSVITKQPVREVKRVGTKVYPHIGSGHFRWPVEVALITCSWYCYSGHQATDVQNRYNFWGHVLASDRGTVVTNSFDYMGGYYMIIDHNNGYQTYYGHMSSPGFYPPGTVVQQGEPIGNIGMTGYATGPHVHFEIRYNGVRLDPETLVGL